MPKQPLTVALERVLGTSRAQLTDAWLTRLGRLASNPD